MNKPTFIVFDVANIKNEQLQKEFREKKVCHDGDWLTLYGRERAKVCSGGFNGCEGPKEFESTDGEPFCKNCHDVILSGKYPKLQKIIEFKEEYDRELY